MLYNQRSKCKIIAGKVDISNVDEFLSLLKTIAHKYGVTIQAMAAGKIADEEHIRSAVKKAIRAMQGKRGITSDLGLEILLYASGKRQIERALEIGVSRGEKKVVIIVVGSEKGKDLGFVVEEVKREIKIEEEPVSELELELDYTEEKRKEIKKFFDITEEEIKAVGEKKLKKLVLERVAMLDILK